MNRQKDTGVPDDILRIAQRCPKCGRVSLSFDPSRNAMVCRQCGFCESMMGVQ